MRSRADVAGRRPAAYPSGSTSRRYVAELRPWVRSPLKAGAGCSCAKAAGACREVLAREPALGTSARLEGVEPTNNAAERALRHAVPWRETSCGTQSEAGSHLAENILTVAATCRQPGRNVLEYLTGCCRAAARGASTPSLLPAGSGAPTL
jgi:transposase